MAKCPKRTLHELVVMGFQVRIHADATQAQKIDAGAESLVRIRR